MPFNRGDQLRNTDTHVSVFFGAPRQSDVPHPPWVVAQGLLWLGLGAERGYFATEAANSMFSAMWRRDGRALDEVDAAWQERVPSGLMPRLRQWAEEGVRQQESPGTDSAVLAFRDAYDVAAQFVSTKRDAFQAIASIMFATEWNADALDTATLIAMFNYLRSVSDIVYATASGTGRIDFQLVEDLGLAFATQLNVTSRPVMTRLGEAGLVLTNRVVEAVAQVPLSDEATDDEIQGATSALEAARERWRVEMQVLLERIEGALSINVIAV